MRILIFNQNLFYLEDKTIFHIYDMFLLINSKIIETNQLIFIFLFQQNKIILKKLTNSCNMFLNVLYEVAMEYYKINVLNKPLNSTDIPYKPFFYKKTK